MIRERSENNVSLTPCELSSTICCSQPYWIMLNTWIEYVKYLKHRVQSWVAKQAQTVVHQWFELKWWLTDRHFRNGRVNCGSLWNPPDRLPVMLTEPKPSQLSHSCFISTLQQASTFKPRATTTISPLTQWSLHMLSCSTCWREIKQVVGAPALKCNNALILTRGEGAPHGQATLFTVPSLGAPMTWSRKGCLI